MIIASHTTPTYERVLIPEETPYIAVVRDDILLTHKFIPGMRCGWIFTEIHAFSDANELQSFVEGMGETFFEVWNVSRDEDDAPWDRPTSDDPFLIEE